MRPLILLIAAAAFAQQRPTFDVLSVKHVGDMQSNIIREGGGTRTNLRGFQYTPGSLSCRTTLRNIVMEAYQLQTYQIQAPDWTQSEVYEIGARMPDGTSKDTARLMLQSALEDRMGLKVRLEQKEVAILNLVVIPGSDKLQKVDAPADGAANFRAGMNLSGSNSLESEAMTMASLATNLTRAAGKPVIDETGREGFYKVSLHWEAAAMPTPEAGGVIVLRPGTDPGMLSAIKVLGLKLEPARKTMASLTIEKVNRDPTEN